MDQGSSSQEEETQDASDTRTMVVSGDMSALTVDSACAEIVDDLQDASSEGFLTQPTQEVGAGGSEAESASDVQQAREEGTAPSDSIVKSSEENDTRRPFTAYTPHPPEYDELLLRLEEPIAMQQLSVYYDTIASLLVEARAEIFDAKDIMWGIGAATQNSFRRTQKLLEENEVARAEIAHWNSKLDELDEEIDSNYPELSDVVQRAQ